MIFEWADLMVRSLIISTSVTLTVTTIIESWFKHKKKNEKVQVAHKCSFKNRSNGSRYSPVGY